MKKRILKIGVILFMVAVLVTAGVYPLTSAQAAPKGTAYKVVLTTGSGGQNLFSIEGGDVGTINSQPAKGFTMVVESKAKTEKVKSTGQKASYYPVTILAKSFVGTSDSMKQPDGTTAVTTDKLAKDAKGKLYIDGGDVDVVAVMGKKLTYKLGDGKADPKGSLFVEISMVIETKIKETGKLMLKTTMVTALTTGTASVTAKGFKGKINGKNIPKDIKDLPSPFAGKPIDLDAGTGTLVGVAGQMQTKNITLGKKIDAISALTWVMNITQ